MTDVSQTEGVRHSSLSQHQYLLSWEEDNQGNELRWRVEQEKPEQTQLVTDDHSLQIDTAAGLTLWLDKPLSGSYRISFSREVLTEGLPNDRLSDVNMFWAARDPLNPDLFTRQGELSSYNSLKLFYAGIGGNWNTTSRFRYYDGLGERHLLTEYTSADRLLRAGHPYQMVVEVADRQTRLLVDDEEWFTAAYETPPDSGYFGFRTVWSRQIIRDFRLSQL